MTLPEGLAEILGISTVSYLWAGVSLLALGGAFVASRLVSRL